MAKEDVNNSIMHHCTICEENFISDSDLQVHAKKCIVLPVETGKASRTVDCPPLNTNTSDLGIEIPSRTMSLQPFSLNTDFQEAGAGSAKIVLPHQQSATAKLGQHDCLDSSKLKTNEGGVEPERSTASLGFFKPHYYNAVKHKTASEILRKKFGNVCKDTTEKLSSASSLTLPIVSQNDDTSSPKTEGVFTTSTTYAYKSVRSGTLSSSSCQEDAESMNVSVSLDLNTTQGIRSGDDESASWPPSLQSEPLALSSRPSKRIIKTPLALLKSWNKPIHSAGLSRYPHKNVRMKLHSKNVQSHADVIHLATNLAYTPETKDGVAAAGSDTVNELCSSQIVSSDKNQSGQQVEGKISEQVSSVTEVIRTPGARDTCNMCAGSDTLTSQIILSDLLEEETEEKITDQASGETVAVEGQFAVSQDILCTQSVTSAASFSTLQIGSTDALSVRTASYSDLDDKGANQVFGMDADVEIPFDKRCRSKTGISVKSTRSLLYQALETATIVGTTQKSSICSHKNLRLSSKIANSSACTTRCGGSPSCRNRACLRIVECHGEKVIFPYNRSLYTSSKPFCRKTNKSATGQKKTLSPSKTSKTVKKYLIEPKQRPTVVKNEIRLNPSVVAAVSSLLFKRKNIQFDGPLNVGGSVMIPVVLSSQQQAELNGSKVCPTPTSQDYVVSSEVSGNASQRSPVEDGIGDTCESFNSQVSPESLATQENLQANSLVLMTEQGPVLFWIKGPQLMQATRVHLANIASNLTMQLQKSSGKVAGIFSYEAIQQNEIQSNILNDAVKQEPEEIIETNGYEEDGLSMGPFEQALEVSDEEISLKQEPKEFPERHDLSSEFWQNKTEPKRVKWLVIQTTSNESEIFKCGDYECDSTRMENMLMRQTFSCYCRISLRAAKVYDAMKAHVRMEKLEPLLTLGRQVQGEHKEKIVFFPTSEDTFDKDTPVPDYEGDASVILKRKQEGEYEDSVMKITKCARRDCEKDTSVPESAFLMPSDSFNVSPEHLRYVQQGIQDEGKELHFDRCVKRKSIGENGGSPSAMLNREGFDIYLETDESIPAEGCSLSDVFGTPSSSITKQCNKDQLKKMIGDEMVMDSGGILDHQQEEIITTVGRNTRRNKHEVYRKCGKPKSKCSLCTTFSCRKKKPQVCLSSKGQSCSKCCFKASDDQELKEHIALEHTGKPLYRCQDCPFQFFSLSIFQRHQKRHQAGFKCSACEMAFQSNSLLLEHKQLQHTAAYYCPLCVRKWAGLGDLKKHLNSCRGKYTCCICFWIGSTVQQLKGHGRHQHSQELFVCCACGLSFQNCTDHIQHGHVSEACGLPDIEDSEKFAVYMKSKMVKTRTAS